MSPTQAETISCPLCGRAAPAPAAPGVLRCGTCTLLFAAPYCSRFTPECAGCTRACPRPGAAEEDCYAGLAAGIKLELERARLARVRAAAGAPLAGLRVLEAGPGLGALGSLLRAEGADYAGFEPVPLFYRRSLENFPELRGLVTNCGADSAGPPGAFDLAIAADVLQYTAGPLRLLARLKACLKPGGRLYLEVPNERLFRLRAAVRARLGLSGSQAGAGLVNFFTPAALRRAAAAAGFSVVRLYQATLLGEPARLRLTLKREPPAWLAALSAAARLTRFDLLLQQGSLVCVCEADK